MKQYITILISVLYLAVIAGLPVHVHFCHGEIVSVKVLDNDGNCFCRTGPDHQGCCSEYNHDECCSDERLLIQYDKEQKAEKEINTPLRFEVQSTLTTIFLNYDPENSEKQIDFIGDDLPPPSTQPLWLLNCSFTFYG